MDIAKLMKLREWCNSVIGPEGDKWYGMWRLEWLSNRTSIMRIWGDRSSFDINPIADHKNDFYRFYFKLNDDAALFKLTWG